MEYYTNPDFVNFFNQIKSIHKKIMYINIFVDSSDLNLKNKYIEAANNHNNKLKQDPHFYDAGFDLFLPKNDDNINTDFYEEGQKFFGYGWEGKNIPVNKVDFKVKCSAKIFSKNASYFTPFYTYARSSMSKTPLRLANNQGIIDAGYRGNLIGMFDCNLINNNDDDREFDWYMDQYSRMLQICAPNLIPIFVNIVEKIEELGPSTSRGEGGFGSTGI